MINLLEGEDRFCTQSLVFVDRKILVIDLLVGEDGLYPSPEDTHLFRYE